MVAPVLTINGRQVGTRPVRGAAHVGIRRVRIEWGRASIYEQQQPGLAIVETLTRGIEPTPPRKGDALTIAHPDAGFLFRGRVADVTYLDRELRFPSGLVETVTISTLTAHDPLGSLAKFIPVSNSTALSVYGENSEGHGPYGAAGRWPASGPAGRINTVADAGARDFVANIEPGTSIVQQSPQVSVMCATEKSADRLSALTLLNNAYSLQGVFASCTYDPTTDTLRPSPQASAASGVVTLAQGAAGVLSLSLPPGTGTLPGKWARVASTRLGSPADEIADIRHAGLYYQSVLVTTTPSYRRYTYSDVSYGAKVATTPGATYEHPSKFYRNYDWFLDPAANAHYIRYQSYQVDSGIDGDPGWFYRTYPTAIAKMNGLSRIPDLTIDPEHPALAGFAQRFRPCQLDTPFYLAASMFHGQGGAPSVVQFIGGTLTYDDRGRWRHTLTPAPTAAGAPTPLTLDQMFPANATDQLDKWADDLTLNDLAAVTRRTP